MGVVDAEDGFGFHRKPGQPTKGAFAVVLEKLKLRPNTTATSVACCSAIGVRSSWLVIQTSTALRTRPALPNTRRYRSTSDGLPVAFSGLSESFTAGRPSTDVTLQTIEMGSRSAEPSGAHPTKSLVRLVPQPKLILTRPAKCR